MNILLNSNITKIMTVDLYPQIKCFWRLYNSILTRIRDTIDYSYDNIYFIGVLIYFFIIAEFKNKDL